MNKYITSIIAIALLSSCAQFSDQAVTGAVSVGTTTALHLAIVDSAKRATVANYIDVGARALRAITGTPTPEQLTVQINAYIPASVKSNYPEILAFLEPLVVSQYQSAYAKWGTTGNGAKIYAVLSDIATGLEAGAAPYVTKG